MTDNKNRTVGEIRHLLGKYGGNLGETNSVRRMFEKKGYIVIEKTKAAEDTLMAAALDAGADDLRGRRRQLGSADARRTPSRR